MKIYKITEASEYLGVSINTLKTLAGIWPDDSQMDGHISVYRKGKEQLTCVSLWRFGAGGVRE